MSVTLPLAMAASVSARVESGDYASENEVVREGLRALQARERAVDRWLREDVAAAYDAIKADPSSAISSEELRASLAEIYGDADTTGE